MIAIITEKPSVAKDIAAVLQINQKGKGYFYNDEYMITWALGHLVALALPGECGTLRLTASVLPYIPAPFRLIIRRKKKVKGSSVDNAAYKQLKVIEQVFNRCDSIIAATDAGREGELIFRWIYDFLECKKPYQRLWINSMAEIAIKNGFSSLRDGSDFDNLYMAADCRAKADYLVGINASQALCFAYGTGNNSIGRVQTPTLSMICSRYLEYSRFKLQTDRLLAIENHSSKKWTLSSFHGDRSG